MKINITLDTEQQAALDGMLERFNATQDEPLSTTAYLETVIMGVVNDEKNRQFDIRASQLVESARSLPYEQRLELIAQVSAAVS
jgi:hypothetical protein